ncbi:hypothetical protein QX776_16175 [Alteromonadaceae bacterium BrNp21-10]|nr:hypothetical protein [Alteromonadaceae bacterium BrNp21-10]
MRQKIRFSVILSSALVVASLSAFTLQAREGLATCACANNVKIDKSLPMSHPTNRCANQQTSEVSWSSWILGNGHNGQFHFLDLLELLSRHTDETISHKQSRS